MVMESKKANNDNGHNYGNKKIGTQKEMVIC